MYTAKIKRIRRALLKIWLACVSVFISLIIVELAMRLTDLKKQIPVTSSGLQYYFESDSELGADIGRDRPSQIFRFSDGEHEVFSNSYGCFDIDEPPPDDYVLLVGDSFSWGYTRYEKKWGTELERRLQRRVLKCGVSGTGTRFQVLKAKKMVRLVGHGPRELVVGYSINDFHDDVVFPSQSVINGRVVSTVKRIHRDSGVIEYYSAEELEIRYKNRKEKQRSLKSILRDRSIIANLLWRAVKDTSVQEYFEDIRNIYDLDLYSMDNLPWVREAWSQHLASVAEFKAFAEEQGAQLVFVLIPEKDGRRPARMAEFLQKSDILFIDLYSEFENQGGEMSDLYWEYDGHLNEKGNQLAGFIVTNFLDRS
jgi:hypothetical protein